MGMICAHYAGRRSEVRAQEVQVSRAQQGSIWSRSTSRRIRLAVVIEVVAAGVSFPDLLLTRGEYQMKPPLPFVPGAEVAGRVRSAPEGSGVQRRRTG